MNKTDDRQTGWITQDPERVTYDTANQWNAEAAEMRHAMRPDAATQSFAGHAATRGTNLACVFEEGLPVNPSHIPDADKAVVLH